MSVEVQSYLGRAVVGIAYVRRLVAEDLREVDETTLRAVERVHSFQRVLVPAHMFLQSGVPNGQFAKYVRKAAS